MKNRKVRIPQKKSEFQELRFLELRIHGNWYSTTPNSNMRENDTRAAHTKTSQRLQPCQTLTVSLSSCVCCCQFVFVRCVSRDVVAACSPSMVFGDPTRVCMRMCMGLHRCVGSPTDPPADSIARVPISAALDSAAAIDLAATHRGAITTGDAISRII